MTPNNSTKWRIASPPPDGFHLDFKGSPSSTLGRLPGRLLYNRGVRDTTQAHRYLVPTLENMTPAFDLPDAELAARRLVGAAAAHEAIGICGDFDVDGLSGTALLAAAIRALGGRPVPYIPHREQDGHGLSRQAIESFKEAGVRLLVTVDTGTSAAEEVAWANSIGLETIITDHHLPGESWRRPAALAVVNPHMGSTGNSAPPSGSGVALRVAQVAFAIAGVELPDDLFALASLGTIADSAPLQGDNRIIARLGLNELATTRHPGLCALLSRARPNGTSARPDAELVSYYLAPRLNAAGRLGDAGPSLRLLMSTDPVGADALAAQLDAANQERQRLGEMAWQLALRQLDGFDRDASALVAVRCDGFPAGLMGPLAGKLCDAYARPAIAMTTVEGGIRGSARSTPGFDIHDAVAAQSQYLIKFGGHARAAGFAVSEGNVARVLEGIERLASWSALRSEEAHAIEADAEAGFDELGVSMWDFVNSMSPFGEGNASPVLVSRGVSPMQVRTIGNGGRHLRLTLEDNGRVVEAIGFGLGSALLGRGRVDIAYGLRTDTWNGRLRRELELKAIRPA